MKQWLNMALGDRERNPHGKPMKMPFTHDRTVAISLQATKQQLFPLLGGSQGESAPLFLLLHRQ
jgi:hypothetical protein